MTGVFGGTWRIWESGCVRHHFHVRNILGWHLDEVERVEYFEYAAIAAWKTPPEYEHDDMQFDEIIDAFNEGEFSSIRIQR